MRAAADCGEAIEDTRWYIAHEEKNCYHSIGGAGKKIMRRWCYIVKVNDLTRSIYTIYTHYVKLRHTLTHFLGTLLLIAPSFHTMYLSAQIHDWSSLLLSLEWIECHVLTHFLLIWHVLMLFSFKDKHRHTLVHLLLYIHWYRYTIWNTHLAQISFSWGRG